MRGRSVAHQEHAELDGVARGGLVRRESSVPALGKMRLTAKLRLAPTRFLLQVEQVEDGGDDGGHGEVRGCSERRRLEMAGRLGFRILGKIGHRRKKVGLGFVHGFIRLQE
jgi:hypothetical protein